MTDEQIAKFLSNSNYLRETRKPKVNWFHILGSALILVALATLITLGAGQ